MEVKDVKLSDLKPYENNPRRNEASVDNVVNSIKDFCFKVPIIIDKNNVIVAGHTRYKAAQKLGMDTVPCIIADDLTPEQVKAFRIADNKVGEDSEWNFFKLSEEIEGLEDAMGRYGFVESELESLVGLASDLNEALDDSLKMGAAGAFTPNLHPVEATDAVTDDDIKAEKEAIKERMIESSQQELKTIVCPYCGKEFQI